MKSKSFSIIARVLLIIVALAITAGAILKLTSFPPLSEIYRKLGLSDYMKVLGVVELLFLVLFIWPRSMRIGLLLLTGYFGGAMAVELSHGIVFIAPGIILSIVWIIAYLRDTEIYRRSDPVMLK